MATLTLPLVPSGTPGRLTVATTDLWRLIGRLRSIVLVMVSALGCRGPVVNVTGSEPGGATLVDQLNYP